MRLNKHAIQQIKLCLEQLSDIEFQERVWLRGDGPEVSSYTETVCQLFDDTALGDFLATDQNKPVLSVELDSIMLQLSQIFDRIDYSMSIKDILNHPDWPTVRKLSSDALMKFNEA